MINKNRLSVLAIAALITVSLAACSSGKKESAAGSQTSAAQVDEIQTSGTQTTDTSAGDTAGKDAVKHYIHFPAARSIDPASAVQDIRGIRTKGRGKLPV